MTDVSTGLLSQLPFLPHGQCFLWSWKLLWTYVIADGVTFVSYLSIPIGLGYFAWQRREFRFNWLLAMFAMFIVACGTTHLLGVVIIWTPIYWIDALLKVVTAILSAATAIALWPTIPTLLTLPSLEKLRRINQTLEYEITKRYRLEERLRRTVEAVPVGLLMVDEGGSIRMVNRSLETMFGHSRSELLGKSIERLLPIGLRESHAVLRSRYYQHAQARQMGYGAKLFGCRADGQEFPVDVGLTPLHTDEGLAILATVMDISMRSKAEAEERHRAEALRESEERHRLVMDAAPDAVISIDHENFVVAWNTQAEQVFGWSKAEALGRTLTDLILPTTLGEERKAEFSRLFFSGNNQLGNKRNEITTVRRNGEVFPSELTAIPIQLRGKRLITAFVRDITNRKIAEAELHDHRNRLQELVDERTRELTQAKEAAEEANRAKSDFLANMSHELRTPMHAILSFARMGSNRVQSGSPEQLQHYFATIATSGTRLMKLLNDLLDLAKLESSQLTLSYLRHDANNILATVIGELRPLALERGLHIELEHLTHDMTLYCDDARMLQVFRNLLGNAIKFSPIDSTIHIVLQEATLPLTPSSEDTSATPALCIAVKDHGIGIPEAELERIFDKFVQSSKTKTGAGGTGLGLAISREIVAAHMGLITAENNADGGATLKVFLPRKGIHCVQANSVQQVN